MWVIPFSNPSRPPDNFMQSKVFQEADQLVRRLSTGHWTLFCVCEWMDFGLLRHFDARCLSSCRHY